MCEDPETEQGLPLGELKADLFPQNLDGSTP
jgi:hypothetical protein